MKLKKNRFLKLACLESIFILWSWIFIIPNLQAQTSAIITGPTTVCPNNIPSGNNYSAQAVVAGINATCQNWEWWVLDGLLTLSHGSGNSFNHVFGQVGIFTVKFRGTQCGFVPVFQVIGSITVNSRVKMPSPLTGPNIVCTSGQALTYSSNPPLGENNDPTCYYHYEYFWTAPPGWSINGQGNTFFDHGHSASIVPPPNTSSGTYTISVQSTIPNNLPGPPPNNRFLSLPRTHTVRIGSFNSSEINVSGTVQICNGNAYTYTANLPGGHQSAYTYNWIFPSGWAVQNTSTNTIRLFVPSNNNSYGPVRVSVTNGCGTSPLAGLTTFPSMNCNFMTAENFTIYPNPSDGELNVEYEWSNDIKTIPDFGSFTENLAIDKLKPEFELEMYDKDQCLVKKGESISGKIQIDTHNLYPGVYFLNIYFGNEVLRKQIMVK